MPVIIGEVEMDATEVRPEAAPAPTEGGVRRPAPPDRAALLKMLRREEQRLARLRAF